MGLPLALAELVSTTSKSTEIEVDRAVKGGSRLRWHWNDTEVNDVVNRIKRSRYDFVVIQDSGSATGNPKWRREMQKYVPAFIQLVQSTGARPLLYCTHEYYNNTFNTNQKTITDTYWEFALQHDAEFLPIGPICKKIRDEQRLILHNLPDTIHANQLGEAVYLYTLYCHLTGEPVLGRHTPASAEFSVPTNPDDAPPPGEGFAIKKTQMRPVKQELSRKQLAALQKTVYEETMRWKEKQKAAINQRQAVD
jgi:hypothetical protein